MFFHNFVLISSEKIKFLYLSPNRYLKVTVFHAGKCANIFLHVFLYMLLFHHTVFFKVNKLLLPVSLYLRRHLPHT